MKERMKSAPDAGRVFATIAAIMTRRGEGTVHLAAVREPQQERKAG